MKAFKRIVSCVLAAAAAALMLTACEMSVSLSPNALGAGDAAATEAIAPLGTPTAAVAYENSRMSQFAASHTESSYSISADRTQVTADGESTKQLIVAFDSTHLYVNVVENGVIQITESTQDATNVYILKTADKTGWKMTASSDESGTEGISDMIPDGEDQGKIYDCGTLTIDGQTLYFESSTSGEGDDRHTSYFCFSQDGSPELLYYVSETNTTRSIYKINAFTAPADPALFVVPADYKITDVSFISALAS